MSFIAIKTYSPMGNAWNLFSAGVFEGGDDPGVPQADDGEKDQPPNEFSEGGENPKKLSTNNDPDQEGNSIEDDSFTRSGGNDRRTK